MDTGIVYSADNIIMNFIRYAYRTRGLRTIANKDGKGVYVRVGRGVKNQSRNGRDPLNYRLSLGDVHVRRRRRQVTLRPDHRHHRHRLNRRGTGLHACLVRVCLEHKNVRASKRTPRYTLERYVYNDGEYERLHAGKRRSSRL